MKFQEMTDKEINYISAYEENWLKINNKKYNQSIIVLPNEVLSIDKLSSQDIAQLIKEIHKKETRVNNCCIQRQYRIYRITRYKEIISMQIGISL